MYTQAEHDADVEHWEKHRVQLRQKFLLEQEHLKKQPFGDGLVYQSAKKYVKEDNELLKRIHGCTSSLNMGKLNYAQRMASKEQITQGPGNYGRGHWRKVSQDVAIALRHRGFDVRFLGGKDWEVFE